MTLLHNTQTDQFITPPSKLVDFYLAKPQWESVDQVAVGELKGKALDDALEANDLPKTGNVGEKRARLADHLAKAQTFGYEAGEPAGNQPTVDPAEVTTTVPSQDQ